MVRGGGRAAQAGQMGGWKRRGVKEALKVTNALQGVSRIRGIARPAYAQELEAGALHVEPIGDRLLHIACQFFSNPLVTGARQPAYLKC